MSWGAIIAAGGTESDAFAKVIGTTRKALVKFGNRSSLARTLDAVREAGIEDVVTVSGDDARPEVHHGQFRLEGEGAVENYLIGADALPGADRLLVIPADTPLMTGHHIREFLDFIDLHIPHAEPWYAAGIAPIGPFRVAFPNIPATPIRLAEGQFLTGALFALSPDGLRQAIDIIRQARSSRKSQIKMLTRLGIGTMIRYGMGRISIEHAEQKLGELMGGRALIWPEAHPATCADFDDPGEFRGLQSHCAQPPVQAQ